MTKPLILGLDDDPDFNNILALSLKKIDYVFKATTTPEEFIKEYKNLKPALCLIDLNLDIAQGAGFQMLQAIRNRFGYEVPILILSRRGNKEDIQRALQLGANDYLFKPLDDIILAQKLNLFLPKEDLKKLPFSKITESVSSADIKLSIELHSINEFGITLKSRSLIAKGVPLKLSSPLLDEIFEDNSPYVFTVRETWIGEDEETKARYNYAFLEYDFENSDKLAGVRKYLLNNS
ncbi:MAG: response regulator [Oligoflexia bacterium]|nr:response regulator [Oligoflexia bacterium]